MKLNFKNQIVELTYFKVLSFVSGNGTSIYVGRCYIYQEQPEMQQQNRE
jgi:hypothetical protein